MVQLRSSSFVLCFRSLFVSGRGYAFPCDPHGQVDLDQLSERARNNYLYARAMVGRELSVPAVENAGLPPENVEIDLGAPVSALPPQPAFPDANRAAR